MTLELGHIDDGKLRPGDRVWVVMKWVKDGACAVRRDHLEEVIYTEVIEGSSELGFHSLDLMYGYPEIKEYVRIKDMTHQGYKWACGYKLI